MATIPIEVIIQDAESPVTPTPESGEETNITVPDTGTISDVGSNSGGIGSSASIILPAIIAVLAIGAIVAIVAMLVHKHNKHQNDKLSKKEKLATVASGTIAILAATVLVGNLVIPATKAATDETNGSADTNEGTYLETEDKVSIVATIDKDSKEPTIVTVKDTLYATTDASGYTVTMSMTNDALTSNLYLNGDESSEYYIAPVELDKVNEADEADETSEIDESATEGVELATNTWGYRLNEEDGYLPVPVANAPATVAEGEAAVTHEEINVYYGLKVDGTLPLGTYSGEIEYNIEGNYGFPKSLITMQGMTHEICESVPTPGNKVTDPVPTATLEDTRDHKTYTIAKLADGKCWMTQNLDLDLKNNVALTPADSDVSENWTPTNSTLSVEGTSVPGWGNSNTEPYSANPGDIYYYTSGSDENDKKYDLLTDCEREHPDGTCSHYHAGNYYNWSAAVASNNTGEMTQEFYNAPDSICPKGWRLPTSRNQDSWTKGNELDGMISNYGEIVGGAVIGGGGSYMYRNYQLGGFNAIRTAPIWLVRSGLVYNASQGSVGKGFYQSSTVFHDQLDFYFSFGNSDVYPSDNSYGKAFGFSVRCLAK